MDKSTSMHLLADRDLRIPAHFKDDVSAENLLHVLGKVFPRDEVLAYFFQICTLFMYNGNANKYSYVFSGPDYRGKDFVVKLLSSIFPSEVLNDSKSSTTLFENKILFIEGDRAQVEISGSTIKRTIIDNNRHYDIGSIVRADKFTGDGFPKIVFLGKVELPVNDVVVASTSKLLHLPFIAQNFNFATVSSDQMTLLTASMRYLILQTVPRTIQPFPPPLIQEYVRRLTPLY